MIDPIFLGRYLIGVVVSVLVFLLVEFMIRVAKIRDSNQKSSLYVIALASCFSSMLYVPFLLSVQTHGNRLVLFFPNIVKGLEMAVMIGFMQVRGGFLFLNSQLIFLILTIGSVLFFVVALVLSRVYVERVFHAEKCGDKRLLSILAGVCNEMKMKVPSVFMIEGVNAFVFGVPAVLAVGKELVKNINDRELELILRHEINHIKHHDNILKPFLFSLRILFFVNPVVHVLSKKIAKEREFLADRISETRKDKVLFLYTLVRLNELSIEKKRLFFSIASSPLVKSNLIMRTETLLSEPRKGKIYPYFVSFWILSILLIAGTYVPRDFSHLEAVPVLDKITFTEIGGRLGDPPEFFYRENVHAQGTVFLHTIPTAPETREFLPVFRPEDIRNPLFNGGAGKMNFRSYSIDLKIVVAAILVISLLFGFVQYRRHNF